MKRDLKKVNKDIAKLEKIKQEVEEKLEPLYKDKEDLELQEMIEIIKVNKLTAEDLRKFKTNYQYENDDIISVLADTKIEKSEEK